MYKRINIKNFFQGIIEYIFILFVMLSFRTPFVVAINHNYHLTEITEILSVILFIVEFSRVNIKLRLLNNWLYIFIPYYIVITIFAILGGISRGTISFIAKFFVVLPVVSLTFTLYIYEKRIGTILKKYSDIMMIIALISLYFWIFGSLLHWIKPTGKFYAYWGIPFQYPSYYNLYFERQDSTFLEIKSIRNIGIFVEGPMYSSSLVIAIAYEFFLKKEFTNKSDNIKSRTFSYNKRLPLKLLILIIALISTITTTGYIMLLFMLFMAFFINNPKSQQVKILKYVFTIIAAGLTAYFIYKIFVGKSTSESWLTRLDDYVVGFTAWRKSPILGNGYNNWSIVRTYMSSFRQNNLGFSNGIFVVLVEGGLLLVSIYLIPAISCMYKSIKQRKYGLTVFVSVILIEFVVAVIHYEFLMFMQLALFYSFTIYNLDKKLL